MVVLTMAGVDEPSGGWEQRSEAGELARRGRHDAWLDAQVGPGWAAETWDGASRGRGGTYPWGRLASDDDTRAGGSSITVDWRADQK